MVNTKTLELTANVVSKINFDKKYPYIYIKNFGDTDVYATELDDITPDADGVTRISAGTVGLIYRECIIDDLYVMSSDNCKIEIIGAYDANLSFNKQIIIGGDEYDDTALRNAINQKADKADVYTKNEAETTSNKVTSITETSTDTEYPSAKAVYNAVSSSSGSPYIYMTQAEYEALTEYEQDRPYWVVYPSGDYAILINGIAKIIYNVCFDISTISPIASSCELFNKTYLYGTGVISGGSSSTNSKFIDNAVGDVNILYGYRKIGFYSFYNCGQMTSVTIPNSVTNIETGAFRTCRGLTSATIPNSVTNISDSAFYSCDNLKTITINKPQDSISGSPWGATNATVIWTG